MSQLKENLQVLEERIAAACRAASRRREDVALMAVSKTYPAGTMLEAVELGLHLFGENRVQEFAEKSPALGVKRNAAECHLIGHLQSNKAARAVELFDGIDSLDSLRLGVWDMGLGRRCQASTSGLRRAAIGVGYSQPLQNGALGLFHLFGIRGPLMIVA